MKISVITPTYNRGKMLKKLYESLEENLKYEVGIEWLIIDDGSTDDTENIVNNFNQNNENNSNCNGKNNNNHNSKIQIKYYKQKNQGKMKAINNVIKNATGDLIVECDSDDYFTKDAFETIKQTYEENKNEKNIYGFCFLKYDQNGRNMGNNFKNKKTTMFDLYFKEGETGEKAIVFYSEIRKEYKHELEENEKFVTEARMYHKMDQNYKMICINKPIMICEYQKDGYTKNIIKQFKENPYGYYQYFKEIIEKDMNGVIFSKRLYVIKHLILFKYLTNTKRSYKNIKGLLNKTLYIILYIPGIIVSSQKINKKNKKL